MAFDAGMVRALALEIDREIAGARIEKINQPEKDEVSLLLHTVNGKKRLVLSASANNPRFYLTERQKENPQTPPAFCIILRKQLSGARIVSVNQLGFERAVVIELLSHDDMGYSEKRYLIAEIMGRYSNIILTDAEKKIIGAVKTIDFTTSSKRQVLPGMTYELPPAQDKRDPTSETKEGFSLLENESGELDADKFIIKNYLGISSALAREIAFRAGAEKVSDAPIALREAFFEIMSALDSGELSPYIVLENEKPIEYCFTDLTHYADAAKRELCESFSDMVERFFLSRDNSDRTRQRADDLYKLISGIKAKLNKKISAQWEEIAACEKKEEYRRMGDLITSNMYMLKKGMTRVEVTDYYSEDLSKITIELDPRYSPTQIAQHYYKKYSKLKTAEGVLAEQIEKSEKEIEYLESVEDNLQRAVGASEIDEIRQELFEAGYGSRIKKGMSRPQRVKPREYFTSSGYRLLCGRNNIQNDAIRALADKDDWWFHVKGAPGSHVIMICNKEEPPAEDFTEAAALAAYFSSQSESPLVSVDYTKVRHLKKPSGAKPGFVTYTTYWSAHVKPKEIKTAPEQ